jgi:tetratricopeptide (TPR) repeat protein
MKSHKAAIVAYQTALKAAYDSPALLYNNIGYSHLALRQFDEAETYFQLAIQADGNLQAPRYSIMRVHLYRAAHGRPIPDATFAHATRAIEIGPPTADLYELAATLYATAAMRNPTLIRTAIEFVGKAIEHGVNSDVFTSGPVYSALQKEPAFHDALKKRATTSNALKTIQLLDPLAKP